MADILEFASFLVMLYAAGIALYVARKANRVGLPFLVLSTFLFLMLLFHGIHHLFSYLQNPLFEHAFELGASISALALGCTYVYVWGRY